MKTDFNQSCSRGGYVAGLLTLKPWFDTTVMSNLFCLTATGMACMDDGGDREVVCR